MTPEEYAKIRAKAESWIEQNAEAVENGDPEWLPKLARRILKLDENESLRGALARPDRLAQFADAIESMALYELREAAEAGSDVLGAKLDLVSECLEELDDRVLTSLFPAPTLRLEISRLRRTIEAGDNPEQLAARFTRALKEARDAAGRMKEGRGTEDDAEIARQGVKAGRTLWPYVVGQERADVERAIEMMGHMLWHAKNASVPAAESAVTRPGRNDLCHCGSGKKYKKCHLEADERG